MASPSMRRLSIMVLKSLTQACEFGAVRARWLILCGGVLSKRGGSQGRAKGESQGRARAEPGGSQGRARGEPGATRSKTKVYSLLYCKSVQLSAK